MDATVEVEDNFENFPPESYHALPKSNFIIQLGWIVVIFAAILFFLLRKWLNVRRNPLPATTLNEDAIKRREAIEAARLRLQERLNRDAQIHKEKMEEEERRKSEKRTEAWEAMNSGRSKLFKKQNESVDANSPTDTKRPKGKSVLRPDYNPLMGDTSCSRFRPTSRFGGG